MQETDRIHCPVCGNKTLDRIHEDIVLINYPLYFPKCKRESLIQEEDIVELTQIQINVSGQDILLVYGAGILLIIFSVTVFKKLYAILGPSDCGKTTLLYLISGLDSPNSGQILFDEQDIAETDLADHRKNHVSFIFQAYNLINYLTPMENVALTSKLPILERLGLTRDKAKGNVLNFLEGQ